MVPADRRRHYVLTPWLVQAWADFCRSWSLSNDACILHPYELHVGNNCQWVTAVLLVGVGFRFVQPRTTLNYIHLYCRRHRRMYAAHVRCALLLQHFSGKYLATVIILDTTGDARFVYRVAAHCEQHVSERYRRSRVAVWNESLFPKWVAKAVGNHVVLDNPERVSGFPMEPSVSNPLQYEGVSRDSIFLHWHMLRCYDKVSRCTCRSTTAVCNAENHVYQQLSLNG